MFTDIHHNGCKTIKEGKMTAIQKGVKADAGHRRLLGSKRLALYSIGEIARQIKILKEKLYLCAEGTSQRMYLRIG